MSDALIKSESLAKKREADLVKRVAMDIAKEVSHHIATMYPEAVEAASSTFLLSVRGCTYNEIMAAINSNQDAEDRLRFREKFRRHIRRAYAKIRKKSVTP